MATSDHLRLPFDNAPAQPVPDDPDSSARLRAVDPEHNVVLEASAGTGKTHVLVDRYLNLLERGVEPANILAITFTRKAAAEMRARILAELRKRGERGGPDAQRWRDARDRSGDVAISTIDAFCLSLLREFPLEANLDPGFEMADETQTPRLMEEALDRAVDIGRGLAKEDEHVRLLYAELREMRLRGGLAALVNRRLVADAVIARAVSAAPRDLTAERACGAAFERMRDAFAGLTGGVEGFLANGAVHHPRWAILADDLRAVAAGIVPRPGLARGVLERIESHFLNKEGQPRQRFPDYSAKDCRSADAWKTHRADVVAAAGHVREAMKAFRRDVNALLSRAVQRVYQIALREYRRTLEDRGVLDFPETLACALSLLAQMDEFARSRYRLEGRFHHVLLDEFQDTSRAQWALVALLIRSWGEGSGVSEGGPLIPSIFVVGDRKQSIYGFRDADVAVMDEAGEFVGRLRPESDPRRAISRSFRAVPELLAFTNDLFGEIEKAPSRRDAFRFDERDRFPLDESPASTGALGIVAAPTVADCAETVAAEVRRLLDDGQQVRDPATRELRPMAPRDVAILFRTRDTHQEYEKALERRQIQSYVYKGLGFFEADEIKDVVALLRYLAVPESNLRAAALLRSRFVRLSDPAVHALAPRIAAALSGADADLRALDAEDRLLLEQARRSVARWLALVDRLTPAEVLESILQETAYAFETRGPRLRQARENLKKIRAMIRRVQNRGYATMSRIAEHLERLSAGDESNAVIDAGDAVSLMTVHAAKGLEFPVVFLVNVTRGTGGRKDAIRVGSNGGEGDAWVSIGAFQSEADEDARARDREETKRLLYVAVTRARDRLYLAADIKNARFRAFGGSLGDILPLPMKKRFEEASVSPPPDAVLWPAASGHLHTIRVVPPTLGIRESGLGIRESGLGIGELGLGIRATTDQGPPTIGSRESGLGIRAITDHGPWTMDHGLATTDSLSGSLVHRLLERFGVRFASEPDQMLMNEHLARLVRDEEAAAAADLSAVFERAGRAYRALCAQPALKAALESGAPEFEVPFSLRLASSGEVTRGVIDCVVRRGDGGITVLEFKTGAPAAEHQQQLAVYVAAARAMFPGAAVDGALVYAG